MSRTSEYNCTRFDLLADLDAKGLWTLVVLATEFGRTTRAIRTISLRPQGAVVCLCGIKVPSSYSSLPTSSLISF